MCFLFLDFSDDWLKEEEELEDWVGRKKKAEGGGGGVRNKEDFININFVLVVNVTLNKMLLKYI